VRLARTIADYVLELDLSTFLADDEDEPGLEAGEAKADEEKAADMDRKPLEPDTGKHCTMYGLLRRWYGELIKNIFKLAI